MSMLKIENLQKVYQIRQGERAQYQTLSEKMNNMLRFKSGEKKSKYKDFYALRDVTFEVKQGDRVGVIGRNGAGKSTLLKLISRVTSPTSGRIGLNGRVSSLLEVGTGFHPELTGRENIYLNGAILGMRKSEIKRKFDEIVDFAGTEAFLETPVKRYSSGMYVRLAFAISAFLESEILIVDEVLAVGDAAFQKKCLGKMDEVSKGGRTILFVSHNLNIVQNLCNRGIYLKDGLVAFDGTSLEAINTYAREAQDDNFGLGQFDLRKLQHGGTGAVRFEKVSLSSESREPDEFRQLRTGDNLDIEVEMKCFQDIKDINVAVIIYDSLGVRLVDANLAIKGESLSLSKDETKKVQFKLRDLLLKPGDYVLGLWAGVPNLDVDVLSEAVRFSVEVPLSKKQYSIIFPGYYQCRFETKFKEQNV